MEYMEQQPPLKKIATDGPTGLVVTNSSQSQMQVETAPPDPSGNTNAGPSSSGQMADKSISNSRGRRDRADVQSLKKSAVLNQVWKDELNSGQLLISMFQLFGEDILPFIPAPEMSLFL